jgi:hypothetical protein
MTARAVDCPPRKKSWPSMGLDAAVIALSCTLAVVPVVLAPSTAYARVDRQLLAAFAGAPVLSANELDHQRGGFYLPNGALVNFGLEVQQFVDHTLTNDVKVDFDSVRHTFNVNQLTGDSTQLTSIPGGFEATTDFNNHTTHLSTTVVNGAIQNVIQNTANNQNLQTVTTLNISTQGFQNALHHITITSQILNTIHTNSWIHH